MTDKPYVSPFALHNEQANLMPWSKPKTVGPNPTGGEVACLVGGIDEEPIPALFHAASRTVYPVRESK